MNLNHYMLDIETLGNGHDGAIVTLGVIAFDPAQGRVDDGEGFYRRVDLSDPALGVIDASNVAWWSEQDEAVRDEALKAEPRCSLQVALLALSGWLQARGVELGTDGPWRLWAKPPEFDVRLLREAHVRAGVPFPFHFRATRDMRTLLEIGKMLGLKNMEDARPAWFTRHNALDDARWQATVVCSAYQEMRKKIR